MKLKIKKAAVAFPASMSKPQVDEAIKKLCAKLLDIDAYHHYGSSAPSIYIDTCISGSKVE